MLNISFTFEVIGRRDSHPQARQNYPCQGILIAYYDIIINVKHIIHI